MDATGPFSHKMVKRHVVSYERMGLSPHFTVLLAEGAYEFRKRDVDRVTGQPVVRMVNALSASSSLSSHKEEARISQVLLRASRGGGGGGRGRKV